MTNSEARKRLIEAQGHAECPLSQPIPAPVDSGAIGRLNEALAAAIDGEWTRPEHDWERMGFDELRDAAVTAVDRIVREHADRALAEAWDAALRHVWALNDPAYTVITDTESIHPILTRRDVEQAANENPYRAARQEQGR